METNSKPEKKPSKPVATFMMGGPGAGKGYVRKTRYAGVDVLDCDEIKKTLPSYDPKNPTACHAESRTILARQFFNALAKGRSFVYDGTGTNAEKYLRMLRQAEEAGFETELVYVKCPLAVALRRNAERERTVPEHIVREKHAVIEESFELIAPYAAMVKDIVNG